MKVNHFYTVAVMGSMVSLLTSCSKSTYQFGSQAPAVSGNSQEVAVPNNPPVVPPADNGGGGGGSGDGGGGVVVNPPPVTPPNESDCGSWETVISAPSLRSIKVCDGGICLNPTSENAAIAVHAESVLNSDYEYKLVVKKEKETMELYPKVSEFLSPIGEKKAELTFKLQEAKANRTIRLSARSIEKEDAHEVQDVQLNIFSKNDASKADIEKDLQLAKLDPRSHSEKLVPNFSLQVRRCN